MDKIKDIREIDVVALLRRVAREWRLMVGFFLVGAVVGVVYALNTQKVYTCEVKLAPEATSMGMSSSLSDIAGMVGLNVGSNGGGGVDAIYPEIYPEVFASTDFIVNLFDIPVTMKDDAKPKTYYNHLIQDSKVPFWQVPKYWLISLFKKKPAGGHGTAHLNPAFLTQEQTDVSEAIRGLIGCQLNKNNNVITISASDIDPCVAAQLADTLQRRLQEYITLYRTKKARNDLEYNKKLNAEARRDYVEARRRYGSYSDANQDLELMSYRTRQEDLENEMQLRFNIYQQTTQNVQQAYAKVQENTPAFTVIQRAVVPMKASSTPRYMMVLGFMVLAFLCDAAWVLLVRGWMARTRLGRRIGMKSE